MVSISLDSAPVQTYLVYSAILALKMLVMANLTGRQRFTRKVFANPEDAASFKGAVSYNDQEVERVRRAHLNDLENIIPFWILGALYLTTGPPVWLAVQLFRVFAIGRLCHTLFYLFVPKQPHRGIAFGIPSMINFYMGVQIVLYYLSSL